MSSTVQVEQGRWRWLDAFLSLVGVGVTGITGIIVSARYKKYGDLTLSTRITDPTLTATTTVAVDSAIGATTLAVTDSSVFPPEDGIVDIDFGGGNQELGVVITSNNVAANVITVSAALSSVHVVGETVRLHTWYEVDTVNAPGHYMLLFDENDLNTLDTFTYYLTGAGFDPFYRTIDIIPRTYVDTEVAPSLSTCIIKDHVLTLGGQPVQYVSVYARLLALPDTVNGVGILDRTVSATTDQNGFFQLTLIQGSTVDITIPDIGYRRTLTVPSTTLANLFEI